jgi:hypothetical protein
MGLYTGWQPGSVVFGHLHQKAGAGLVEVVFLHPAEQVRAPHRGEDNAVFDLTGPDFPGGEQGL